MKQYQRFLLVFEMHQEHTISNIVLQSLQSLTKRISNKLRCRLRLLREPQLNLKTLLEIWFNTESAQQQATEIENNGANVNKTALSDDSEKQSINKNSTNSSNNHQIDNTVAHCYGCGNSHSHLSFKCPAKEEYCNYSKRKWFSFSMLQK